MAETCGLLVDRAAQIERLDDAFRRQLKVLADGLGQLVLIDRARCREYRSKPKPAPQRRSRKRAEQCIFPPSPAATMFFAM